MHNVYVSICKSNRPEGKGQTHTNTHTHTRLHTHIDCLTQGTPTLGSPDMCLGSKETVDISFRCLIMQFYQSCVCCTALSDVLQYDLVTLGHELTTTDH